MSAVLSPAGSIDDIRQRSEGVWHAAWRRFKGDRVGLVSLAIVAAFLVLITLSAFGLVAKNWQAEVAVANAPPTFLGPAAKQAAGAADRPSGPNVDLSDIDPLAPRYKEWDERAAQLQSTETIKADTLPFGADRLGRDVLAKAIKGTEVSVFVGVAAALCATLIGTLFGALAGFGGQFGKTPGERLALRAVGFLVGGATAWAMASAKGLHVHLGDVEGLFYVASAAVTGAAVFNWLYAKLFGQRVGDFLEWLYNVLESVPGILLIFAFAAVLGRGIESVVLILALTGWTGMYRQVRAEFIKHASRDYVRSAEAVGASPTRRMFRHILPNVSHVILVRMGLLTVGFIKAEVILSYLGLGVGVDQVSWGTMLAEAQSELILGQWWQLAAATLFMAVFVTAFSLMADAMRDALDPKLRGLE
jgi:oligopeptide transport system permease protein